MERTGQWVFSQRVSPDIVIQVGEVSFPLHKFMLVAKSGYIQRKIMESDTTDLTRIDLSGLPGGAGMLENAAKFCYGVNFEITAYNVAALLCAAEYLEMTEMYCDGNLRERTEMFMKQAALKSLTGAAVVLRSCEELLPMAENIGLVQQCIDIIALKACNEAIFPTRSPTDWYMSELTSLPSFSLPKLLTSIKSLPTSPSTISYLLISFAEKTLPLSTLSDATVTTTKIRSRQHSIIDSISTFDLPVGFLCRLLRAAIFLNCSPETKREIEQRISADLELLTVGDLVTVVFDYAGEKIVDLESVRRIVAWFVEREEGGLFGGSAVCSTAAQKVASTLDAFVGEISVDEELGVSKFTAIAGAMPKKARQFDDGIYRAVDIYLKAHPSLDEIEREKVCSVMDPLRLSYEARLHASQNKRLPLQVVLHALYYDQLNIRSTTIDGHIKPAPLTSLRRSSNSSQSRAGIGDTSLVKENEALRSELTKMKLYVTNLQKDTSPKEGKNKGKFFSSMSKTLGKLNPFRQGSKDTTMIVNDGIGVDVTKPRRRRFSIS